jgi:hypothetical protein
MKNKVTLLVLLAEIIAIVVLHTTRASATDPDRSATIQSESQFQQTTEKHPVSYTSLK